MTEPILGLTWLYHILTNDSVLTDPDTGVVGGFQRIAPAGPKSPYGIVRHFTASEDLTGLDNGGLIWVPMLFQTNLYDRVRNDYTQLDVLAQRIYTVLQAASGSPTGGIIYSCHRVQIYASDNTVGDAVEISINQHWQIYGRSE